MACERLPSVAWIERVAIQVSIPAAHLLSDQFHFACSWGQWQTLRRMCMIWRRCNPAQRRQRRRSRGSPTIGGCPATPPSKKARPGSGVSPDILSITPCTLHLSDERSVCSSCCGRCVSGCIVHLPVSSTLACALTLSACPLFGREGGAEEEEGQQRQHWQRWGRRQQQRGST